MPPMDEYRREEVPEAQQGRVPDMASDRLMQEAYQQPPERYPGDRAVNSIRSQNYDNPVDHLDRARDGLRRGDFRSAEREYFAAIRAADNIDQREVARERELVKQQMEKETNPQKRRELIEWDTTLNDMQRAPGFTRANLGLVYLRMGYQAEGVRMLMEASARDPQMMNDPNFLRRLQAIEGGRQPRDMSQYPNVYGPPRGQQEVYDPHRAHSGGRRTTPGVDQGTTTVPGDQGGAQPPPDASTRPGDGTTTPADQVRIPSGNARIDAQNFDNPYGHVAKANEEFAKSGKLTPETKAEYEAAIKAADNIDRNHLAQQAQALQQAFEKAYPAETQQRVAALEKERDEMLAKLPKEKQDKLTELATQLQAAKTDQEREELRKKMRDEVPEVAAKQDEIDGLMAQPLAILEQLQLIQQMQNSSALTRFAYAEALRQSGDKAAAKQYLEQVVKLDPKAAEDAKFQEAAKDVGLEIKPAATASDAQVEKPPTAGGTSSEEPDAFDLLQQAHEKEAKDGFAAAKPLYEQAIAAADKIDQKEVADQIKAIEERLKQSGLSDADKQQLQTLGAAYINYQHAPFITRFQYGIAQNNSGDSAGAKKTLEEAAAKDPEAAKESVFQAVVEKVNKGEKIEEAFLKEAAESSSATAGGGVEDNPYQHIEAAQKAEEAGNAKTAETEWKAAVAAADKLPMDDYKARLAEVEQQLTTEKDPVKSQELLKLKEGLKEVTDLPVNLRLEMAVFYLKNAKPDEAKQLLEQALQMNPALKDQERFKQLASISQENSKDTIEKSLDFLKKTGKELISDMGAGTVGLAVTSLTPGGRILRLGAGILAGGATKHTLNLALGSENTNLGRNMLWGGVDTLAFVSGAGVRKNLMGRFEAGITTTTAKEMAMKAGISDAGKLAMLEGKTGLEALKATTAMISEQVAAKKALASAELKTAIAAAPAWKKPLLWTQGHAPVLWRLPNQSLQSYQQLTREAIAARGSRLNIMNPLNMFSSVENFSTLKNLEARTFWNRYRIDAAAVGTASLVYNTPREVSRIGTVDQTTGKTYSAYDAVSNIALKSTGEAISGGFLIAGFRGMGGFFTKHSGAVGEVTPLTRPVLAAESSLYSRVTHPFRLANYGFQRYAVKPIGDLTTRGGQWLSGEGALQNGLRTTGGSALTGAAIFSPKLYEAYGSWEKIDEYEKVLAEIQKPLEDKASALPGSGGESPAPQSDKPAEQPELPAEKPADQPSGSSTPKPPAQPEKSGDGSDVGAGLPE